jgi:hypothetical protein
MTSHILLMVMGAALCFVAYFIRSKYKKLMQTGEKTEGTPEGYETVKIKNNMVKVPVANFVTKAGKTIRQQTADSFFSCECGKRCKDRGALQP